MSSHLLPELAAEAIARSFLPRRDTPELERRRTQARESEEEPPSYATEAIFLSQDLIRARVDSQRHARSLRAVIEHSLNEAGVHGTGGVRLIFSVDGPTLTVRVGNRPAADRNRGIGGEGGRHLDRLAARLPNGTVTPGIRPAADVRMPAGAEWWVVELRCSVTIFETERGRSGPSGKSRPSFRRR
jgi:hypothetical protein